MQHFLPFPSFVESARVLDRQRLGKQRMESRDTLLILLGQAKWCSDKYYSYLCRRYKNHPAVLQWSSNEVALLGYLKAICEEWTKRGYKDNCLQQAVELCKDKDKIQDTDLSKLKYTAPYWLGYSVYHSTHRSSLLYKNIRFYKKFGWKEAPRIRYYWPVTKSSLDYCLAQQVEFANRSLRVQQDTLIDTFFAPAPPAPPAPPAAPVVSRPVSNSLRNAIIRATENPCVSTNTPTIPISYATGIPYEQYYIQERAYIGGIISQAAMESHAATVAAFLNGNTPEPTVEIPIPEPSIETDDWYMEYPPDHNDP